MKSNYFAAAILASLLGGGGAWASGETAGTGPVPTPYVIDHPGRADSLIDMRFLLDGPAGKHGFLSVRDGHFRFADAA